MFVKCGILFDLVKISDLLQHPKPSLKIMKDICLMWYLHVLT